MGEAGQPRPGINPSQLALRLESLLLEPEQTRNQRRRLGEIGRMSVSVWLRPPGRRPIPANERVSVRVCV